MGTLSLASQADELRYKFQAGSKTNYAIEQHMKLSMTGIALLDLNLKINMNMDVSMAVDSVDAAAGNAKITYQIDRVKVSMEEPLGNAVEFDSNSDKVPDRMPSQMPSFFKALKGARIIMTVSQRGKLIDLKCPEKLKEEFQSVGDGGQMTFFSEDYLIMNLGISELPHVTRKNGTTWNKKQDMKSGSLGTMGLNTTYTYVGKSGRYDKIDMKIDMELEAPPNSQMQMKMKTKDASGTILFDNVKGRIQEMKNNVAYEIEVGRDGKLQMTQDTTLKMKQ
jgi:hypothetical protein